MVTGVIEELRELARRYIVVGGDEFPRLTFGLTYEGRGDEARRIHNVR